MNDEKYYFENLIAFEFYSTEELGQICEVFNHKIPRQKNYLEGICSFSFRENNGNRAYSCEPLTRNAIKTSWYVLHHYQIITAKEFLNSEEGLRIAEISKMKREIGL